MCLLDGLSLFVAASSCRLQVVVRGFRAMPNGATNPSQDAGLQLGDILDQVGGGGAPATPGSLARGVCWLVGLLLLLLLILLASSCLPAACPPAAGPSLRSTASRWSPSPRPSPRSRPARPSPGSRSSGQYCEGDHPPNRGARTAGRQGRRREVAAGDGDNTTAVGQSTYRTDVFMAAVIAEIGSRDAARQEAHTAAAQPWMVGSTRKTKVIPGPRRGVYHFTPLTGIARE